MWFNHIKNCTFSFVLSIVAHHGARKWKFGDFPRSQRWPRKWHLQSWASKYSRRGQILQVLHNIVARFTFHFSVQLNVIYIFLYDGHRFYHIIFFYRIIGRVVDLNGKRVPTFFQCTKCSKVLQCITSNGTKPLNSHADSCDESGEPSAKRKKGSFNVIYFKIVD